MQSTGEYSEGSVQELFINENRKNVDGFHCPMLHCGKHFIKSCDLAFHFNVESGNKPFVCQQCHKAFRRPSALHRHHCPAEPPKQQPRSTPEEPCCSLVPSNVQADLERRGLLPQQDISRLKAAVTQISESKPSAQPDYKAQSVLVELKTSTSAEAVRLGRLQLVQAVLKTARILASSSSSSSSF